MTDTIEATIYQYFVGYVAEQGDWVSRRMCADAFEVHISTATYHLEKAVQLGALTKIQGFIGRQPGWIYGLPEWQPALV